MQFGVDVLALPNGTRVARQSISNTAHGKWSERYAKETTMLTFNLKICSASSTDAVQRQLDFEFTSHSRRLLQHDSRKRWCPLALARAHYVAQHIRRASEIFIWRERRLFPWLTRKANVIIQASVSSQVIFLACSVDVKHLLLHTYVQYSVHMIIMTWNP